MYIDGEREIDCFVKHKTRRKPRDNPIDQYKFLMKLYNIKME